MKDTAFATYIRQKTKTNTVTFTDAEILSIANVKKDDIAKEILKVNEDYFGMPATADLVAGQREYPFPSDILNQIKAVELKFVTTNTKYVRAKELDLNQYERSTDETTICLYFTNTDPYIDIFRGSLWIYSGTIIDAVAGIKLWYVVYPADLTTLVSGDDLSKDPTTTSHGFPRPFHEILARAIIIDYKLTNGFSLDALELKYDVDLEKAIDSIKGLNLDRIVIGKLPSGKTVGDDGAEY